MHGKMVLWKAAKGLLWFILVGCLAGAVLAIVGLFKSRGK